MRWSRQANVGQMDVRQNGEPLEKWIVLSIEIASGSGWWMERGCGPQNERGFVNGACGDYKLILWPKLLGNYVNAVKLARDIFPMI